MSKANLKRWAFDLFLKLVMSETVCKSADRVPCHWTGEGEDVLSEFGGLPHSVARRI